MNAAITDAEHATRFQHDIRDHSLEVLHEAGVIRQLRCRRPGTITYGFDILTWPGHLCITGDMGTYVFSRLTDMLEFFRSERGDINPGYWAEKVLAEDRCDGITKYSEELFRAAVRRCFDEWFEDSDVPQDERDRVWSEIEDRVLVHANDPILAPGAAFDFQFEGFWFADFFEINIEEYTPRFLWCCHAIVWAIQRYDERRQPVAAEVPA